MTDQKFKLIGVITDGDIQISLTQHGNLSTKTTCGSIANKNYVSARNHADAMQLLNDSIRLVPVVDEAHRLIDQAYKGTTICSLVIGKLVIPSSVLLLLR